MKPPGGLRIASGSLRGRRVRTPPGQDTRPLLTRLRKALADILRPRLPGARVLDLFGGSGAIGFELLSNGAASAVFGERDEPTASLIRANASDLGVGPRVEVFAADALRLVGELSSRGARFDLVVVAPPYGQGLQALALEALDRGGLLAPDGTVVVQREGREPPTPGAGRLRSTGCRRYGRTVFEFFEAAPDVPPHGGHPSQEV